MKGMMSSKSKVKITYEIAHYHEVVGIEGLQEVTNAANGCRKRETGWLHTSQDTTVRGVN